MVKKEYTCDTCKEKISYESEITTLVLRRKTDGIWWAQPCTFEHVCADCQNKIAQFIINNLPPDKQKKLEVTITMQNPLKKSKKKSKKKQ